MSKERKIVFLYTGNNYFKIIVQLDSNVPSCRYRWRKVCQSLRWLHAIHIRLYSPLDVKRVYLTKSKNFSTALTIKGPQILSIHPDPIKLQKIDMLPREAFRALIKVNPRLQRVVRKMKKRHPLSLRRYFLQPGDDRAASVSAIPFPGCNGGQAFYSSESSRKRIRRSLRGGSLWQRLESCVDCESKRRGKAKEKVGGDAGGWTGWVRLAEKKRKRAASRAEGKGGESRLSRGGQRDPSEIKNSPAGGVRVAIL